MTPDHGELLYEGKAKRVFASTDPDRVLVEFKNDATAFNAQKKAQLDDKGRLNCQISARLFELLEREGVPTHYCGLAGETWMLVRRVEIIPLEVVLRNTATGSLCRQTPIAEGTSIEPALLDLYYRTIPWAIRCSLRRACSCLVWQTQHDCQRLNNWPAG